MSIVVDVRLVLYLDVPSQSDLYKEIHRCKMVIVMIPHLILPFNSSPKDDEAPKRFPRAGFR